MTNQNPAPQFTLSRALHAQLAQSLRQDFEAFLAPGEKFRVQATTQGLGHSEVTLVLHSPTPQLELTLHAMLRAQDQPEAAVLWEGPEEALDLLLEFLRLQLHEFFRQDRAHRPEPSWHTVQWHGMELRFAGTLSSPEIEAQADALLERQRLN